MTADVLTSADWEGRIPPTGARKWLGLAPFLSAIAVAIVLALLASRDAQTIYLSLRRPVFGPPAWLFGPAWSVLYPVIAVAGWLVWVRRGVDRSILAWAVQMVLNALWTPLFFGAGMLWTAFADLCLMWACIVACIVLFARRREAAAWLMVPYLAWVSFAGALNLSIAAMN